MNEVEITPDDIIYFAHQSGEITTTELYEWYLLENKSWRSLNEFMKRKEII